MKKLFALLFILMSSQLLSNINWSSPPTTLSTLGVDASSPLIVIDGSGNSTVAWVENGLVKAKTLPFGGSWSAVSTLSGSGASSPKLALDGSGNATAVWVQNGVVKLTTLPFGGSWSAATSVSFSGASAPSLAMDATGNTVVVWIRNGFVETSTQLLGGLLSLVQMLSTNGTETSPDVYIGANGKVVAVWGSVVSGNDAVYYATKQVNGAWSASATILPASAALHHKFPRVVVDPNGNATALWYRFNLNGSIYTNVQVLSGRLPSGGASWGTLTLLSASGLRNPSGLYNDIKTDSNGNILAFWTNSYDGDTFNVESAVLPFGGVWSLYGSLVLQNLYAFEGNVSVTSAGTAVASYMAFDGISSSLIQSSESDIGGTVLNFWSIPSNLSTGMKNSYTRVAASLSGSTIFGAAVWIGNNGLNNVIQAATGTRTAILPPTGLSISQNSTSFGTFADYFNTLNWTASSSPNIIQYLLYRNGVFFTRVDPSTTQFVDHNAVQNGAVTYGIIAVDSSESVSAMATINFP